jgi:hypothetical protein
MFPLRPPKCALQSVLIEQVQVRVYWQRWTVVQVATLAVAAAADSLRAQVEDRRDKNEAELKRAKNMLAYEWT